MEDEQQTELFNYTWYHCFQDPVIERKLRRAPRYISDGNGTVRADRDVGM